MRAAGGVVTVAVLSSGFGSGVPTGPVTVAVLLSVWLSGKSASAVAVMRKTATPLLGRLTVALIDPVPDVGPVDPPPYVAVQVAFERPAGSVSVTVAPVTEVGPLLPAETM